MKRRDALIATFGYMAWAGGLLYYYVLSAAWIVETGSIAAMILFAIFGTFVFLVVLLIPFLVYRGITDEKRPGAFRK